MSSRFITLKSPLVSCFGMLAPPALGQDEITLGFDKADDGPLPWNEQGFTFHEEYIAWVWN